MVLRIVSKALKASMFSMLFLCFFYALYPLNLLPNNLRSVRRHREVISFGYLTIRMPHLVAEQVHRSILFGKAGAVGMAEIVVFEINI